MTRDDLERLQAEYLQRDTRMLERDLYTFFNKSYLFTIQQRAREVLELLRRSEFQPLSSRRILEVGCGQGGVLLEYISFGASTEHLHGCDLIPERVKIASQKLPDHLPLIVTNGQHLPYKSHSFDLVLQYTVFSSILSDSIKQDLAAEMLRVLRPGGMILWYDFWLNRNQSPDKRDSPNRNPAIVSELPGSGTQDHVSTAPGAPAGPRLLVVVCGSRKAEGV